MKNHSQKDGWVKTGPATSATNKPRANCSCSLMETRYTRLTVSPEQLHTFRLQKFLPEGLEYRLGSEGYQVNFGGLKVCNCSGETVSRVYRVSISEQEQFALGLLVAEVAGPVFTHPPPWEWFFIEDSDLVSEPCKDLWSLVGRVSVHDNGLFAGIVEACERG